MTSCRVYFECLNALAMLQERHQGIREGEFLGRGRLKLGVRQSLHPRHTGASFGVPRERLDSEPLPRGGGEPALGLCVVGELELFEQRLLCLLFPVAAHEGGVKQGWISRWE